MIDIRSGTTRLAGDVGLSDKEGHGQQQPPSRRLKRNHGAAVHG